MPLLLRNSKHSERTARDRYQLPVVALPTQQQVPQWQLQVLEPGLPRAVAVAAAVVEQQQPRDRRPTPPSMPVDYLGFHRNGTVVAAVAAAVDDDEDAPVAAVDCHRCAGLLT